MIREDLSEEVTLSWDPSDEQHQLYETEGGAVQAKASADLKATR